MKLTNISTYSLVLLLVFFPQVDLPADEKTQAAEQAAVKWLALVDSAQHEASWNEAASLFRNQISTSDWVKSVTGVRNPLGELVSRNLVSATYATSLPGAPDGEYVVLQFQSVFEHKAQAIETVTPKFDEGQWRVAGYYIR